MMRGLEAAVSIDDSDVFFVDNRSESYRNEREGNLFVRRDPHQVRPPADTGVEYGRSEADQTYHLSLNDPPQRAEYGWNSARLNDTCYVCQACRDVFNYYCRYVEARVKVGDSVETLSLRETELKSIWRGQRTIVRDLNSQIPSCTTSILFHCLRGQALPNVTYVKYFWKHSRRCMGRA